MKDPIPIPARIMTDYVTFLVDMCDRSLPLLTRLKKDLEMDKIGPEWFSDRIKSFVATQSGFDKVVIPKDHLILFSYDNIAMMIELVNTVSSIRGELQDVLNTRKDTDTLEHKFRMAVLTLELERIKMIIAPFNEESD